VGPVMVINPAISSMESILIIFLHLHLDLPDGLLPTVFGLKVCVHFSPSPYVLSVLST
jgi:hypothetical protein